MHTAGLRQRVGQFVSLSVCHAGSGRLTQLHIIRRPWIEDSKVLERAGRTLRVTEDGRLGDFPWPHTTALSPLTDVQAPHPPNLAYLALKHALPGLGPLLALPSPVRPCHHGSDQRIWTLPPAQGLRFLARPPAYW